jgi:hypothetical protein
VKLPVWVSGRCISSAMRAAGWSGKLSYCSRLLSLLVLVRVGPVPPLLDADPTTSGENADSFQYSMQRPGVTSFSGRPLVSAQRLCCQSAPFL